MLRKLARDWRIKVFVQQVLGLLPARLGFAANEWLVGLIRGDVDERVSTRDRIQKGIDNLSLLRRETGFSLDGKRVLEWGTGWHGIDLILFHLLGAARIVTVDHHAHLTLESLRHCLPHFADPDIVERMAELGFSEGRLSRLTELAQGASTINTLLESLDVDYLIRPSSSYDALPIEQKSIDLFYSESVLQRIPEEDLRRAIRFVGSNLMAEDGVSFHRTDQKDINAQQHLDSGLWPLQYLRYNDRVFRIFLSGRFNSQNRLRESDFLELFESGGLKPTYVKGHYDPADVERLRTVRLAPRFRAKDLEDLATTASIFVGARRK